MNIGVIKAFFGRTGLILVKYSPEILTTVGVVGIVASTVLACRATLKVEGILEEAKAKLDKVKFAHDSVPKEDYSEKDYQKDLIVVYTQTSVEFIKLYGPSATLGLVSIACLFGAQGILKKRNVAIIAAYKAAEESFANYRRNVVSEFGEDKDAEFKRGSHTETSTVVEVDENGKKTKRTVKTEVNDPNGLSVYARYFDESCVHWEKVPEYNFTFLKCQQNYANDLLHSRGHIFLNEVYDMLGFPRTQAGAVVGWVRKKPYQMKNANDEYSEGDGFVDFGIFDTTRTAARDFVNGYERVVLLDFNVDGIIYDLI